ncbi:hypothetical protein QAD02_005834 [Eretmocerus hayati]|uniref:Uncharacterized protein n=1 Tax=Eretmocerus hayati TaxID=131215 RepID=A0ACC2NTY6_9HYME|nr:hypothetical protein QAD02_005834 [Eretmocerus hayati]
MFFSKFITELNHLLKNGIVIEVKIFKVRRKCFICDRPARAFVKQTQGHAGLYACERCHLSAIKQGRKIIFPAERGVERTDATFRPKSHLKYHTLTSPLEDIDPTVNLIKLFIIESMHAGPLGNMKRLLTKCWIGGEKMMTEVNALKISDSEMSDKNYTNIYQIARLEGYLDYSGNNLFVPDPWIEDGDDDYAFRVRYMEPSGKKKDDDEIRGFVGNFLPEAPSGWPEYTCYPHAVAKSYNEALLILSSSRNADELHAVEITKPRRNKKNAKLLPNQMIISNTCGAEISLQDAPNIQANLKYFPNMEVFVEEVEESHISNNNYVPAMSHTEQNALPEDSMQKDPSDNEMVVEGGSPKAVGAEKSHSRETSGIEIHNSVQNQAKSQSVNGRKRKHTEINEKDGSSNDEVLFNKENFQPSLHTKVSIDSSSFQVKYLDPNICIVGKEDSNVRVILRKCILKNVAWKVTAKKPIPDKVVLNSTEFGKILRDRFVKCYFNADKKDTIDEDKFLTSMGRVLNNVKDWDKGRKSCKVEMNEEE